MKKIVALLAILVLFAGGCSTLNQKETLTREQQDNVVKRIIKLYDIKTIEFIGFNKDGKTGTYLLNIKINDDEGLQTTVPFRDLKRLENSVDDIGLNPVNVFRELEREVALTADQINIENIEIIYMER